MALEYNHGAYFPVVLSLIKLHLRSLWYIVGGGKQPNLILWGEDAENEGWWPKLWKNGGGGDGGDGGGGDAEQPPPARVVGGDDDDPIQRARDIRDAAVGIIGEDEDPGEDFFDGMTRRRGGAGGGGGGGDMDELEDDWELVVLALLVMGIGTLVLVRRFYEQRRLVALERERIRQAQLQRRADGNGVQQGEEEEVNQPPLPMPAARPEEPLQDMAMFI
jgi:SEL1 protein